MRLNRKGSFVALFAIAVAALGVAASLALGGGPAVEVVSETVAVGGLQKVAVHTVTIAPATVAGVTTAGQGPVEAPGILPAGTPPPIGGSVLTEINGWLAADGSNLIAVYAGSDPSDPSTGRLVIVRQSFPAGTQSMQITNLAGSGALTIKANGLSTPSASSAPGAVPAAALNGSLAYSGASGASGQLNLTTGTASATPSAPSN